MKFDLEPNNRNCPDSVLLADLRRVAEALGRKTLTNAAYNSKGRFHRSTLQKRFGSWNLALERSGLEVAYPKRIPKKELIEDLKRVSSQLGKAAVSKVEYGVHGNFSTSAVLRIFGSWRLALQEAGLTLSSHDHPRATDDELLENLGRVWERLGRQPRTSDLDERPLSSFCSHTYRRRFGSLRNALEAFVASIKVAQDQDATTTLPATTTAPELQAIRHRTSRHISWRLKFLVMRRDNFKCCITGRSPATDPKVLLEVDHIVPWDKGGETVMANLQTLCREINLGKSNLDMRQNA